MKKLTIGTCVSILAFLLFFISCRKQEKDIQVEPKPLTSVTDPSFFNKYVTQDPIVQKVITYVKKQNEAYNFVPKYHKVVGLPRWDKAIVVSKSGSTTSRVTNGSNTDTSMIYVPFAKDSQQIVSAALIVKLAGDSISSRMLFKWQYSFFGYEEKSDNTWNAKDVFNLFVKLDNTVFGTTKFKVYNYNFLPEDIKTSVSKEEFARGDFDVMFTLNNQTNNSSASRVISFDVCNTYSICLEYAKKAFRAMQSQSAALPQCIHWGTQTMCTTYWFTVSDDPNEGSGSGGWGAQGSGSGSGSSGDWWTSPENPENCLPEGGDLPPVTTIDETVDPCGTGWTPQPPPVFNEQWFNQQQTFKIDLSGLDDYPCAKEIVSTLISLNNKTSKMIKDLYGESTKYDISFKPNSNMSTAGMADLTTGFYKNLDGQYGKLAYIKSEINLNTEMLAKATKVSIARTVIHEMLHTYFAYRSVDAYGDPVKQQTLSQELGFLKPYDPAVGSASYGDQHEQMAHNFKEKIVEVLKEYYTITEEDMAPIRNTFPNLTVNEYYDALAWGGLAKMTTANGVEYITKAWKTFEETYPDKAMMNLVIMAAEQNGTELAATKTTCN